MTILKKIYTPHRVQNVLAGVTRGLLGVTVFFTPLFFLPGLNDPVELPKAALFLLLTLAASVCWVLSWIISGEVRWRRVTGMVPLLLFAAVVILSSIFSIGHIATLFGSSGYIHHSLPILLGVVLFVVLLSQVVEGERDIVFFVSVLTLSFGITALVNALQVAGVSPWFRGQSTNFLVSGNSSATFALITAMLVPLSTAFYRTLRSRVWRTVAVAGFAFALLGLVAVDYPAAWIAALVGSVVTTAFVSLRTISRVEVGASAVTIMIAVLGLLLPINGWLGSRVSPDLRLDTATSWEVTTATLASYPIIGSGPSTFFYDFVSHQPVSFVNSELSQFRFVKASDEGLQILSTLGILGVLSLLGAIVLVMVRIIADSAVLTRRFREDWGILTALFGVWIALIAGLLFVPSTVVTFTAFWMCLGLMLVAVRRDSNLRTARGIPSRLGAILAFFLTTVSLVFTTVWSVRLIVADRGIVEISQAVRKTESLELVSKRIDKVIRLNPAAALPYLLSAQNHVVQAQLLVQQQSSDTIKIQNLFARAMVDVETAVSRDPGNPAVLEAVAEAYKNIGAVTGDTGQLIIHAYERAISLEPNNPVLRVNVGQAYYFAGAALASSRANDDAEVASNTSKARAAFEAALQLKSNDIDASFGLVLVDEFSGEKDRALSRLIELTNNNPRIAALWYELGLREVERDAEKAKTAFTAAVQLQPSLAQAHWQLGLLAEKHKDFVTARKEFEAVQQLDPSHPEVTKMLQALPKP